MRRALAVGLAGLALAGMVAVVQARPEPRRGEWLRERLAQRATAPRGAATLPPGATVQRGLPYGPDRLQRLDVYRPAHPDGRLLVLVHGGGWRRGDRTMATVVDHKLERWLPAGVTVVSVDYRLLPEAPPALQAGDVARAVVFVQRRATEWGADPDRLVLMGHSAGGHLAALLAADPAHWRGTGLRPWRATVALDAGALDVPTLMARPHAPLFDAAFGPDPAAWGPVSPLQQLAPRATPLLLVCSTERRDASCGPADATARRAHALGVDAAVLPRPLSHRAINDALGEPGGYTDAVEAFLARHDPGWRCATAVRTGRIHAIASAFLPSETAVARRRSDSAGSRPLSTQPVESTKPATAVC